MSQPKWKTVMATDYSKIQVDETGVYEPEMEIAQEYEDAKGKTKFQVFRFGLEQLKVVKRGDLGYVVSKKWKEDWPHPLPQYEEWFIKDLDRVASSTGSTKAELVKMLCSNDVKERAYAYESIGSHHGFDNLDSYPLTLTESQLNKRWDK